jgi:hypothetical protein
MMLGVEGCKAVVPDQWLCVKVSMLVTCGIVGVLWVFQVS